MEFAIIQTGGKQYKVAKGSKFRVEKLEGNVGDSITIDTVLLTDDGKKTVVGAPFIKGATVTATITEAGRGKKIEVVKYRQKSRYHKRNGHRQPFTAIEVTGIK